MNAFTIKRISTGSIYRLVFVGSWIGSIPIFLFLGALSAAGVEVLEWNESYITGAGAIIGGPLLGLFLATFFGAFIGSMMALGLWIYSKFRSLTIFCEREPSVRDS